MQDLKVTLVQANQVWEDKQANLINYERILSNTIESDIIILPEMFHTGFSMEACEFAETMENSIGLDWLKKFSKEKNSSIYTSLIIEDDGCFYNRGVFVTPSGEVTVYDKRKRFALAGEDKIFDAGYSRTIVEYKNWKIQLQICYDLRFPEIARNKLDDHQNPLFDILIYVANWPEKRSLHWKTLLTARAIENQCYTIGVNRVGEDGKNLLYAGDSLISNALGVVSFVEPFVEEAKTVTISKVELNKIRLDLPFLKD
jgi:omega-amidase